MASEISAQKDRLWRGGRITNRLSRFRHFRGHGVHSPYIYSIVRNVFMSGRDRLQNENIALFEQLTKIGTSKQTAKEIANLATHCNFHTPSINSLESRELIICSKDYPKEKIENLAIHADNNGIAIVILSPYSHLSLCNSLLKSNCSTSIDRFRYLIFLNNHLPKQHFKL